MSIALDQAINYRSKYAITVDSKTLTPKKNKGYSRSRSIVSKVVNVFLVFSILAMAVFGFSGGNIQKAEAANLLDFDICDVMNTNGVWYNQAAPVYMGALGVPKEGKITAYEKFGTAGTEWTVWRGPTKKGNGTDPYKNDTYADDNAYFANGDCIPESEVLTAGIANPIFSIAKIVVFFSGLVYQTAFDGKDSAIVPMQEQISKIITGDAGQRGLKDSLYLDFLVPIIMLSALYIGWVGLVKRKSTDAMSAAGWMLGSAIVGLFLLINPMLIPNATNQVIKSVTGAIMTGITASSTEQLKTVGGTPGQPSTLCTVEETEEQQRKITRIVQCSLWYSFIYVPWATGQYGVSPTSVDPSAQALLRQHNSQMEGGVSLDATGQGNGNDIQNVTWPIYQINSQVLTHGSLEARDKFWVAIPKAMLGEPSAHPDEASVVNTAWKGDATGGLIAKSVFSLIASVGSGIMIISLGMSMIVFEIGLVILMLLSPLFLLIGVHPGFGRRIALSWLETIISLTLKRIILSVLLGVMITFYGIAIAIPESSLPWFGTIVLIIAISIAGFKYKDTVTDMFGKVNLGGNGPMQEPESNASGAVKGALAAGTGAVIGSVLAGRASSSASVIRPGSNKAGENARRDGTGGSATQRARGSQTLEQVEGLGGDVVPGLGGGHDDVKSGPATSRAEASFGDVSENVGDAAGVPSVGTIDKAGNEVAEGLAGAGSGGGTTDAPLPKRSEVRAQEQQKEALAVAAIKRQKLEERLNNKTAKTSTIAHVGSNFRTVSGAMVKGAFMGANGGDVSFIAMTAQAGVRDSKTSQRKKINNNVNEAKERQSDYSSAWDAYNSATTQAEKAEAEKKIQSTYKNMSAKEKSYLKGVGRVQQDVNKAMGLPTKPVQPAGPGQNNKKSVLPKKTYVNPNQTGSLPPRRPQA